MAQFKLRDLGNIVAHQAPSTSDDLLVFKHPSYEKGETPEQLKSYMGQVSNLPGKCEGKNGQAYTACLTKEAKDAGLSK